MGGGVAEIRCFADALQTDLLIHWHADAIVVQYAEVVPRVSVAAAAGLLIPDEKKRRRVSLKAESKFWREKVRGRGTWRARG